MADEHRSFVVDRTVSTPETLATGSLSLAGAGQKPPNRSLPMTPPLSPVSPHYLKSSPDLSSGAENARSNLVDMLRLRGGQASVGTVSKTVPAYTTDGVLICPYEVDTLKDSQNNVQVYGYGAWSTVFKGTCRSLSSHNFGLATPPPSPEVNPPVLVAIKKPARKDAISILDNEARILTHLTSEQDHESYVVQFYGIIQSTSSLILAAMPQSLDDYIKRCAAQAIVTTTVYTMTKPVVGGEKIWLDLADRLIHALSWLHNEAMVVHGDIKPGNILLSSPINHFTNTESSNHSDSSFPFTPLLADFSSSQLMSSVSPAPNTLSAVTREYTAPELLSSKVLSDPNSTATTASDVFSLAVTLLVAATGNTMVYSGSVFQRQYMATQGWTIISNVRNSDEGLRIPKHGIVDRVVERGVLKQGMGRIEAHTWVELVANLKRGEPIKV